MIVLNYYFNYFFKYSLMSTHTGYVTFYLLFSSDIAAYVYLYNNMLQKF